MEKGDPSSDDWRGVCPAFGWGGGRLLDRNRLCAGSILVPGYFLLLIHMAWCIGKVLGPGVRAVDLSLPVMRFFDLCISLLP